MAYHRAAAHDSDAGIRGFLDVAKAHLRPRRDLIENDTPPSFVGIGPREMNRFVGCAGRGEAHNHAKLEIPLEHDLDSRVDRETDHRNISYHIVWRTDLSPSLVSDVARNISCLGRDDAQRRGSEKQCQAE